MTLCIIRPQRRVKVVPGPILRITVEGVAGDQTGFADPIEELVSSLSDIALRESR
jgi:hypothetical protein